MDATTWDTPHCDRCKTTPNQLMATTFAMLVQRAELMERLASMAARHNLSRVLDHAVEAVRLADAAACFLEVERQLYGRMLP